MESQVKDPPVVIDTISDSELEKWLAKRHITIQQVDGDFGLDAYDNIVFEPDCIGKLMTTFCGGVEKYDGSVVESKKETCEECWKKADEAADRWINAHGPD